MPIHRNPTVRRALMPLFARANPGDITVRHPHTGDKVKLDCFRHRGFWFRSSQREAPTMEMLKRLIAPGQYVLEAGGHIGFMALYFSYLVGPGGKVVVFEPGDNNLPYLTTNVGSKSNTTIVREAVGDFDGEISLFVEGLTGQNNSIFADYSLFEANKAAAHLAEDYRETKVPIVKIDTYVARSGNAPDFLKVDIEGAELEALIGASRVLAEHKPAVMVEITRRPEEVVDLMTRQGYVLFDDRGNKLITLPTGNTFALHEVRHSREIVGLLG